MKKSLLLSAATFICLLFCFGFIDPTTLTPIGFLPIIGLVYLFSASMLHTTILLFVDAVQRKQKLLLASILAFSPTILFALMTLSNLAALDVVLALILPVLAAWYGLRLQK